MDRSIKQFFKLALEDMNHRGKAEILCPCKKCRNEVLINLCTDRVMMHLLKHDFMSGYTRWTRHGENSQAGECEGLEAINEEEKGKKKYESDAEHEDNFNEQDRRADQVDKDIIILQKGGSDEEVVKKEDFDQSGIYPGEEDDKNNEKMHQKRQNFFL